MPNKDPFSADFDPMDEDALNLGTTQAVKTKPVVANGVKPKAVAKVSNDPMEQDIGEAEIGFTPANTGVSNFWTTKKSATPAPVAPLRNLLKTSATKTLMKITPLSPAAKP